MGRGTPWPPARASLASARRLQMSRQAPCETRRGHQVSSSSRLSGRLTILDSHRFGHLHLCATCPYKPACLDGGWDVFKAADSHIEAKLDSQLMLAAPAGISESGSGELQSNTLPPQMSADFSKSGLCPSCTELKEEPCLSICRENLANMMLLY